MSEGDTTIEGSGGALAALIVDDSGAVRGVLRGMLEADGIRVLEAATGGEALATLQAGHGVGVVFLDVHMPDMGGLEVLQRIKADPTMQHVAVVVLTGSGPPEAVHEARELGAVGWLQKPVRLEAMVAIARRYLSG